MRLISLVPTRHLGTAIRVLAGLAGFSAIFGVLALMDYMQTSETSGMLWWRETRQIPVDERRPSLVAAVLLFSLTAVLLVLVSRALWHLRRSAGERRSEQEAEERRRAHESWLRTPEGAAWTAFHRGDPQYAVKLRVSPPEHREAIRDFERAGWVFHGQDLHRAVHTKESKRNLDGGHTVVSTSTQDATFYFVRPRSA